MEKSLFTILLVFLSVGVLFGSYKYFEEPPLKVKAGVKNGNLPAEKRLRFGDSQVSSKRQSDLDECYATPAAHESLRMYNYQATREPPYMLGCFKGISAVSRQNRQLSERPPF